MVALTPDQEAKALEVFFTSATDHIYAVRPTVPPEVFGSFGSFFSRNPKDMRTHMLDAMQGRISGHEAEVDASDLQWLIQGEYREPWEAIKSGLSKSRDFFKKWYGKYSHKSIANTVWIPMVATGVSQLFARELAYDQLAFFIEQSTRFVKFKASNVHQDPEVMKSQHARTYMGALNALAGAYDSLTEQATSFYKKQMPFDKWLEFQQDPVQQSSPRAQQAKYDREMNGKAFDISRFLLPQATKTNLAWILDARSHEFDVAAWKGHPLTEIKEAAELIERHAGQIAPSLLKYTEKSEYYSDKLGGYNGAFDSKFARPFEKGVTMISHDPDSLNKTIAHLLKRHNAGGSFSQRLEEARNIAFNDKVELLRRTVAHRGPQDEWVETDEDFDLTKVAFEIRTDIGAIRDWRRHQKWDRGEGRYTLDNGFHRPAVLDEMPVSIGTEFDMAMEVAHIAEKRIRRDFPFAAQYVLPMATNHSLTMSGGLDQAQYMIETRTTPAGNFSYHEDALNIAEAVARTHPWMLGYEQYPEGIPFRQVHEEAPLKGLMRIQAWEVGLHQ